MHFLVLLVSFPDLDRCQSLHRAATWCLLLPCTVKSSVGMLYGLFCIDLYALSYAGAIDVVVWQWEVSLSDSERCQTLHIAAVLYIKSPGTNINCTPTPRAVFAPLFLGPQFGGPGLGT